MATSTERWISAAALWGSIIALLTAHCSSCTPVSNMPRRVHDCHLVVQMFVALVFSFIVVGCGFATLRGLRLLKAPIVVALLVPAGLAVLAIVSTWLSAIPLPPPTRGVAVVVVAALGLIGMLRDRLALVAAIRSLAGREKVGTALLAVSLVVPAAALGIVFWGVEVPL